MSDSATSSSAPSETAPSPLAPGARSTRRRWLLVLSWLVVVVATGLQARSRGLTPLELTAAFGEAIRGNWWGPAVFIIAYALRPAIAFPGSLLTVLAGVLFGPVWGTVWVVIGSNASTSVTYLAGRFVGNGGEPRRLPATVVRQVERARRRPFVASMLMRLLYLPFDAVGWVAGLARLPFRPFIAGSAIGTVPGIVSFVGFGASVDAIGSDQPSLDWPLLAVSVALVVAGIGVSRLLSRRDGLPSETLVP